VAVCQSECSLGCWALLGAREGQSGTPGASTQLTQKPSKDRERNGHPTAEESGIGA